MFLKTRTVIFVGVSLVGIHFVLSIVEYAQFLENTLDLKYLGFFSIFFVLWGCMHLLASRLFIMNQQTLNASRNNPLMKNYMKLQQYYESELSRDEIKLNLSSNSKKKNSVYHLDDKGNILISDGAEEVVGNSHVGIKLFDDENNITLATEVIVDSSHFVSKSKIVVAILLFFFTFFGVIAAVFAFTIHIISMIELMGAQKKIRNHLNNVDEIIYNSTQMSTF